MNIIKKTIIINYINVGGLFGYKEDTLFEINKNISDFLLIGELELKQYVDYCLFGGNFYELNDLETPPNVQVDFSIDGTILHVIRMPGYTKTYKDGKKVLEKELLSYKYGDIEVQTITNKKFEKFLKEEFGIIK